MTCLIAIDPGRYKCGLILADPDRRLVLQGVTVKSTIVLNQITNWNKKDSIQSIILGNGTTSNYWQKLISQFAPVITVDEKGTTLRARERYWELWPPSNWRALLPRGVSLPPNDLDAVAALLLLEDYLQMKLIWTGSPPIRIGF